MTRIRIMCDQTDGTTIKLGTIQSDETGDTLYSAHPSLTQDMYRGTITPDELDLLALALWEANGERPTVYESGKAVADDVLEWWKQVAASAWGFINGTEAMQ